MRTVLVILVLYVFSVRLVAQRPPILDPKIQNESNDDVREIQTRDELAHQADGGW